MSRKRDPLENVQECPNCDEPVTGRTCSNCGINPNAVDMVTCTECGSEVPKERTEPVALLSGRLCQRCYPDDA